MIANIQAVSFKSLLIFLTTVIQSAALAAVSPEEIYSAIQTCNSTADSPNKTIPSMTCMKVISENIPLFCVDTQMKDFVMSEPLADMESLRGLVFYPNAYFGNMNPIISILENRGLKMDNWRLSVIPSTNAKLGVMSYTMPGYLADDPLALEAALLKNEYRQLLKPERDQSPFSAFTKKQITMWEDITTSMPVRIKICNDMNAKSNFECSDALGELKEVVQPSQISYKLSNGGASTSFSLLPVYKKVLTDIKYQEGARLAALKMLKYFKEHKVPDGVDVFSDLINAYQSVGMSKTESIDRAFDILALISTGGPNIGMRLLLVKVDPALAQLEVAISTIALAIPYLDWITSGTGHLYSLPRNIKTHCPFAKTYHFWMAAYLAKHLKEKGYSSQSSAEAVFISEKAYQIQSTTPGHYPAYAFTEPPLGAWNNVIRGDIILATAGAAFGVSFNSNNEIDLDHSLIQSLKVTEILPQLSDQQAQELVNSTTGIAAYNRWQKIFHIDDIFHEIFSHVEQ